AGERRHGACHRIILLLEEDRDVLRLNLSKHLRPPVPVPVNVSARGLVGSRDVDPFRYRCTVTGTFVRIPTATAPERRAPRGEARRTFLTEAALTVIARVGPDGLTHRLVAGEAGLPLAATTYWFSSKEEIVRAALEYAADRDLAYLESLRAASREWTPE